MLPSKLVLGGLFIYPIKSCGGIPLSSAVVEARGLQHDRRWMLVDEKNMFMTQRQFPTMSLIEVSIIPNGLMVKAPRMNELVVSNNVKHENVVQSVVWNDIVATVAMGSTVNEWFSDYLRIKCSLVYQPDNSIRPVDPDYVKNNEHTSLSDGYPFLILSDSSVDALNEKLMSSVPMNRFRPNLTISGSAPFEEDSWKTIRINGIIFRIVKSCGRCAVTTVDQATGVPGKEPLSTLSQFRMVNNKVLFGQNAVAETTGTISVGDTIEIVR